MQDDVVLGETKKFKFNWKIFGIVMTILAVAGLVFGVVMLFTKNGEVAKVKAECKAFGGVSLTCPDGTEVSGNPVIEAEAPETYTIKVSSSSWTVSDGLEYLGLSIRNGEIVTCKINKRSVNGGFSTRDCEVNGVVGKIYKVEQVENDGSSQGAGDALGFIMTNGTVEYLPLDEDSDRDVFDVKGTLNIDGFVVDMVSVESGQEGGFETGAQSTLFVLKDGKTLKFDKSMLEGV